ncbi:MAG TPA: protein-glutamate O-methyltransferase CheR [Longimicrobiaceae bacterium]|nr:protein-glutamate O-methyltransferase CheR [Longimicrobiaceae bacterium]
MSARAQSLVELDPVLRFVGARTGLSFSPERRSAAEASVRRAMARAAVGDPAAYLSRLRADPAALDDLLAELTVGETYFFREPAQLDYIRREVLPTIGGGRPVRAWSAGCATGEEAYSLAILLHEAGRTARVVGTDLSRARLSLARRARYTRWSLRGVGRELVGRYFRRTGPHFELVRGIREAVTFTPLNLAGTGYPSPARGIWEMDLILCRNVLIYLDEETIAGVARRLMDSLGEDGWLFLGASDPSFSDLVPCEVVITDAGLAYRRARRSVPAAVPPPRPDPPAVREHSAGGAEETVSPPAVPVGEPDTGAEADDPGEAAWVERVRSLANQGRMDDAGRACAAALDRYRTSAELSYLHAVLLAGAGLHAEAAVAARRVLYLDHDLAVAHLLLGSTLSRLGDRDGARRALRNAERLLAALPPSEPVPGSDGEPAARLAEMARVQLRLLSATVS